eukprot:TRINITY_DN6497_c0_g1_i1.p1 TRINITY_DN6497_c0_g1~~TRINITY_DN6497_c0_g1_i1.p1  ORF type:complete len:343 (+),score=68.65 TRINITY_DN6497_c0_g1_i1:95-1123(+)
MQEQYLLSNLQELLSQLKGNLALSEKQQTLLQLQTQALELQKLYLQALSETEPFGVPQDEKKKKSVSTFSPRPEVTFKCVLVGDGGVGKSTFVKKLLSNEFFEPYQPTIGVSVSPYTLETNVGPIIFNIWDCAGQEKFGGLRDGYYIGSDCGIIMFDVNQVATYDNAFHWHADIVRVTESAPVVFLGNKTDTNDGFLKYENFEDRNMEYYEISVKNSTNLLNCFLYLARKLLKNPYLNLKDLEQSPPTSEYKNQKKINLKKKALSSKFKQPQPKRAVSAYMVFCKDQRPVIRTENPKISITEISRKVANAWKELTDEEKEPYIQKALEDKIRYEKELADYTK